MQFLYINTATGQFGLTIRHVRRAMPNVSVPDDISTAGSFQRYRCVAPPKLKLYQKLIELAPINGVQRWAVVDYTHEEVEVYARSILEQVIAARDELLANSNWTMLPDADLTPAELNQWKEYRAALRDANIHDIITGKTKFPEQPSKVVT